MIEIVNDGPGIVRTNYWDLEHARRGLCYLSGNAGVWRLLVPPEAETMLAEMKTGHRVSIEPSVHLAGHVDVVFEDGTDYPFSVAVDPKQVERKLEAGDCYLAVWTRRGCELTLACKVKAF